MIEDKVGKVTAHQEDFSSSAESAAPFADQVKAIRWYHRMHLPGGITTDGVSDTDRGLPRLHFPASFAGCTVLDVGCWDGFYSFEAARRGASRVLATDSFAWSGSSWGRKDGFELVRKSLGFEDKVEDQFIDVMELSPESIGGSFDVVLFLGILYHLKDPIGGLERAASVCRDLMIIETETSLNFLPYPASRVFPGSNLGKDDTNWYSFNVAALRGLLATIGFSNVEVKWKTHIWRRFARAVVEKRHGGSFRAMFRSGRVVLHARR